MDLSVKKVDCASAEMLPAWAMNDFIRNHFMRKLF